MRNLYAIIFVCLLSFGAESSAQRLIDVLIIDGFSNHDWRQTTAMTRRILEETGLFKVTVTTVPPSMDDPGWKSWSPVFSDYDVVIQNTNNIQNKEWRWPAAVEKQLEKYVSKGGGLYILHSANNAFPHWLEYDKMIGLGWRPKEYGYALHIDSALNVIRIPPGEGQNTFHGKRTDVVIRRLNAHPINNGFPDQWLTPSLELYKYARGPAENVTVLSHAYDSATNKNWPVEWVIRYGKGRVYNSSMGHLWKDDPLPISFRCIGFQTTMIRATEWLGSNKKTTWPVPANFPSRDSIRTKDKEEYIKK